MSEEIPLLGEIKKYFGKQLAKLPKALRERVRRDFPDWDKSSPEQRYELATDQKIQYLQRLYRLPEWNSQHGAEDEQKRQAVRELFERKEALERKIKEVKNDPVLSVSDRHLRNSQLAELEPELEKIEFQWRQVRGDFHSEKSPLAIENKPTACQAVSAAQIRRSFPIFKDEDRNDTWWKKKMRAGADNGLEDCRVGAGKKGPGGSMWRPDMIAGWLVDRHDKGRDGMSSSDAATALKKFPGCNETADVMFAPDE